ncbi:elongation factor P 5-aminopentanone reductase [Lederbergia lenta]|uniref:Short-chain dehydrogenase/reductase SDR n=1 Tax=Lederbergia lenta TaxID=1467 RepID=A0A2X4WR50_LEDLE|nr:SDR family oxidoreductase [Lederbergia lenta]MCM3110086.1 SDR family oxidoreductase [Lederbergia lenta]MEC2324345.1 SDR family oxidoreductase [Lederbergia lenta]SQI60110.1 short-chain dehydrogenase/reductase SDR [Lederbergia lenta]
MGKYALITGASGGIGSAIAQLLASKGWNLYLHYNKGEKQINELLARLDAYSIEVMPIRADLETDKGSDILADNIFQLDAIVNSSGNAPYGLFTDLSDTTIDQMLQLHVKSPIVLIRKLLPKLMGKPSAHVVLISSIWGQTGAACEVMYSTVKGAQIAFAKALSKETARSGVRVNCVAPGAVKTAMLDWLSSEELSDLEEDIPIGRLADPKEIAEVVSFLLSKQSSYITGQVIAVNGGMYT